MAFADLALRLGWCNMSVMWKQLSSQKAKDSGYLWYTLIRNLKTTHKARVSIRRYAAKGV